MKHLRIFKGHAFLWANCLQFFPARLRSGAGGPREKTQEKARTPGRWASAHVACSRFAFSSKGKKGLVPARPDPCDGRRKFVFDKVRASDPGTACFLALFPFLTLSTVWQNIVLSERDGTTEQQMDVLAHWQTDRLFLWIGLVHIPWMPLWLYVSAMNR